MCGARALGERGNKTVRPSVGFTFSRRFFAAPEAPPAGKKLAHLFPTMRTLTRDPPTLGAPAGGRARARATARAAAAASDRPSVTLLDYGAGNVRSLRNAVKALGYELKEVRERELGVEGR